MLTSTLSHISNAATWRQQWEVRNQDDDLVDLVTDIDEITLSLRDPDSGSVVKEITLSGGDITRGGSLGTGVFESVITSDEMNNLTPKTYEIGVLLEVSSGDDAQLVLGRIPVLRGL